MKPVAHVLVGGVRAAILSRAELTDLIVEDCIERRTGGSDERPRLLFDVNGQAVSLAARDRKYREALEAADVIHADGGWVVLASRHLSGAAVPERSATTDLIHDLAAAGVEKGLSHYLLGSSEQVNAACAERLQRLHPGIRIAGRRNGYFAADEEGAVLAEVNEASPDLLWVGLGKPREQLFALRNREKLCARWLITCGGCFNYIAGDYRRAPRWMQDNHLEWLFRAATTPRLIGRYATTSPHALWLALTRRDRAVIRR
jgi:exopolysaccharide biosynthesis WecB/TagA/CpsF family protein